MSEVPKFSEAELLSEVVRLNVPRSPENPQTHPMVQLSSFLHTEHPLLENWAHHINVNMTEGMSIYPNYNGTEGRSFRESFVAAYGLIRFSYAKAQQRLPLAPIPAGVDPRQEARRQGSQQDLLELLGERMHDLNREYPALLQVTEQYAQYQIPTHGRGFSLAASAIAAAEVYYSFVDLEAGRWAE